MKIKQPTRGFGLFEMFLAKKRANLANRFISNSSRKGSILDIGCGSQPFFLLNTKFGNKYGIDPFSRGKVDGIIIKKINVETDSIPFKDNSFKVIVMLAVFEHINEDRLSFVLSEIKRTLVKDGVFIMTTPAPWGHLILRAMSKLKMVSQEEIRDHKHAMSASSIKKLLDQAGFSDIKQGFFEGYCNMWFTSKK